MLVDMAGSENIEQAGQNTFEAKMQVISSTSTLHCPLSSPHPLKMFYGRVRSGTNFVLLHQQTAKINQGNVALKRVVESIANGDSHVPFRDSKLTMLLQVKFHSS